MKKKVTALIMLLSSIVIFWISLSWGSVAIGDDNYRRTVIGFPAYVVFDSAESPYGRLIFKNILVMSIALSSLVFLSGYLFAHSKKTNSNQSSEPTSLDASD